MLDKSNQRPLIYVRQSMNGPFWMEDRFRIIGIDGTCKSVSGGPPIRRESNEKQSLRFQLQAQTARLSRIVRVAFLPVGFPETVSTRYFKYIGYNMIQVTFISLSRVLSTQAMLLAVGLGQGSALPLAAVMNWILKDGLGHLGSIVVGASINTKFDSDPKRYKFLSVFLGQGANLLGILSLARPGMFLLLTSLSSALSRVGTLAITSSRARIYANFSKAGNIGDLMRCSQAQSTLATLVGTAAGVILSPLVGADINTILGVFVPVSILTHLYAYKAVSVIELRTINRQRLELIVDDWLKSGFIPSVRTVAERERFVLRNNRIFGIDVNPEISSDIVDQDFLDRMASCEGYCVRSRTGGQAVDLFLRESCSPEHVIKGSVEACFVAAEGGSRKRFDLEWTKFWNMLHEAGWDTSVTFIDEPAKRVALLSHEYNDG